MPLSKHFEHVSKTCSKHIQCVFKSKNTFNEFSKHIQFVFKSKNTFNAFSKHIECVCSAYTLTYNILLGIQLSKQGPFFEHVFECVFELQ